jgi:hypothetical protein
MTEPDLVARLDELAAEGNGRYTDILWDSWPQISRRLKAAEAVAKRHDSEFMPCQCEEHVAWRAAREGNP